MTMVNTVAVVGVVVVLLLLLLVVVMMMATTITLVMVMATMIGGISTIMLYSFMPGATAAPEQSMFNLAVGVVLPVWLALCSDSRSDSSLQKSALGWVLRNPTNYYWKNFSVNTRNCWIKQVTIGM